MAVEAFIYTKDKILGSEIIKELYNQYINPIYDVTVDSGTEYDYRKDLLEFHCNRCGFTAGMSAASILQGKKIRGSACTKCAGMSNQQLEKIKEELRNQKAIEAKGVEIIEKSEEEEDKSINNSNVSRSQESIDDILASDDEDENTQETTATESAPVVNKDESPKEEEDNSVVNFDDAEEEVVDEDESDDDVYDPEVFKVEFNKQLNILSNELGYCPFVDSFSIKDDEPGFDVHCQSCNRDIHFDDLESLSEIKQVIRGERKYKLHNCPNCLEEINRHGKIISLEKMVHSVLELKGVELLNPEKYSFITMRENYKLRCEGEEFTCTLIEFLDKYVDEADLRPRFRKQHQERLESQKKHSTESTTPISNDKAKSAPQVKPAPSAVNTQINKKEETKSEETTIVYPVTNQTIHETVDDTLNSYERERILADEDAKESMVFTDEKIAVLRDDINPFEIKRSLLESFKDSCFSAFINDLGIATKTKFKIIIDSQTADIPFVDFESGYRIICIDDEDINMYSLNYDIIQERVPFAFKECESYKFLQLYSEQVQDRRGATMGALIKIINPEVLPYGSDRIELQTNYKTIMFTQNMHFIKQFEEKNSPSPYGKASSGRIGLLVQNERIKKNTVKDTLSFLSTMEYGRKGFNLRNLSDDYDTYMVASIRYIEQPNKEKTSYIYTITDYTEISSTLIADGLYLLIGALTKVYNETHPEMGGVPPIIKFERDPNLFCSPSIKYYIDKGSLVEPSMMTRLAESSGVADMNQFMMAMYSGKTLKKDYLNRVYIKRPDMRTGKNEDNYRQDIRTFNVKSLITRMSEEIKNMGYSATIKDDNNRRAFIKSQGYEVCTQRPIVEYEVSYNYVMNIMWSPTILMMQRLPEFNAFGPTSGVVEDPQSLMSNPFIMAKFFKLMNNDSGSSYVNEMTNRIFMNKMMGVQNQDAGQDFVNMNQQPSMAQGFDMNQMMQMQMMMNMFQNQ